MKKIWEKTLAYIENELDPHSFNLWFAPTSFLGYKDNRLIISVPNQLFVDWLEEHYPDLIRSSLEWQNKKEIEIEFIINSNSQKEAATVASGKQPAPVPKIKRKIARINPGYTFDSFIVGNSNQFAHAASEAVAKKPARVYNPLYIYGGAGLGKTHLLNAIGNHTLKDNHDIKIIYISTEAFMNELINAIRYDRILEFRNKYRSIDILLIDDIQFIAGKERTQEEFFHTFNALYESNKQIVISSDCPPKNIPTVEDRLCSRFAWGLIADIQIPDLETKIAIIQKKAEKNNFYFPNEVCMLIASNIHSNVRELEGSMTRVIAQSSITGQEITLDLAKEVLKHIIIEKERRITIENIQIIVATFFKLKVSDLKSKSRLSSHAAPRQIAMYLCRQLTKHSLPTIGNRFGGKDHTTVLHACNKMKQKLKTDTALKVNINHLTDLIQNGPSA